MGLDAVIRSLEPLRTEAHRALNALAPDDPAVADWVLAAGRVDAALQATERLLAAHDPSRGRRRWGTRPVGPGARRDGAR